MLEDTSLFMICIDNEVGYIKPHGNNKVGYINQCGEVVIKPKYSHAWDFKEGVASVALISDGKFDLYVNLKKVEQL